MAMLEKLYAHGVNWQLVILMIVCFLLMRIKYVGNVIKGINTLFHESGHAIAALLSNGEIYHIKLNVNTSGEALTSTKGWFAKFFVSISGYLFPLFICACFIIINKYFNIKYSLYVLLAISLTATIMWVRNTYGYIWSLIYLSLNGLIVYEDNIVLIKVWIAFNICALAVENLMATIYLSKLAFNQHKLAGDAYSLKQATFLPTAFWAIFFLLLSVIAIISIIFLEHTLKIKIY